MKIIGKNIFQKVNQVPFFCGDRVLGGVMTRQGGMMAVRRNMAWLEAPVKGCYRPSTC
jgi:hypothetical protein